MRHIVSNFIGKSILRLMRLRGGGSALPGLVVERIDPSFLKNALGDLPYGVAIISGTNGKTTTTKMVVELLESQGLRVFTNKTGSNFVRGVIASALAQTDARGRLDADIAVLELDEAHAKHFIELIPPRYSLLLNVLRDQLDRFGEIDTTAQFLQSIANTTTDTVVVNRDDPFLGVPTFTEKTPAHHIATYGTSTDLRAHFPSDEALHGIQSDFTPISGHQDTSLDAVTDDTIAVNYGEKTYHVSMQLKGLYNLHNAVGAIALCRSIIGDKLDIQKLHDALSQVTPAFGRGEVITIDGRDCELVLVKNPSGFRQGLASFSPAGTVTAIAINDNYADGRDMSWLWDVDFTSLKDDEVASVGGVRAYDMALRLQYDDVRVQNISSDLNEMLTFTLSHAPAKPIRIYCTYTAMLEIRKLLSAHTEVPAI